MGKTLYLDLGTGISGDMTAAALIDLGGDQSLLKKGLDSLTVGGFKTEITRVKKSGIDCCDFNVILDSDHDGHDHDMNYLYGPEETKDHHTHHHHHEHRSYQDIREIIDKADLTDGARRLAQRIFLILAEAESKAHAVPIDEVHFHEVGAVDSIVDILSIAILYDSLDIDEVIIPQITEGTGHVRCQHGVIPVPVPAVVNIAEKYALPLHIAKDRYGELVTPTGAAFAAAVKTSEELPERFHIIKCGLGAGKRDYEIPGIVRAMLIEEA